MKWGSAWLVLAACTAQNPAFVAGARDAGEDLIEDAAAPADHAPADTATAGDNDASAPDVRPDPLAPDVAAAPDLAPADAAADAGMSGLQGEYFDGNAFNTLQLTRVDSVVDFAWANTSPDPRLTFTGFTVRWTGRLRAKYSETYTFTIHSGDGARFWLNDTLVIDDWKLQAPEDHSGTIKLTAGQLYDLKLEYLHETGYSVVRLDWQSASQAKVVVPSSALLPD